MPTRSTRTLRRRRLGSELRRLREAVGLTIDQVAAHLDCSTSKISRIETGNVSATLRDIRDILEIYGVSGQQQEVLLKLAREARQKDPWWPAYGDLPLVRTLISLERAAASIRTYQALVVPGLLQVEGYARTILSIMLPHLRPEEIERHVELRMARQLLLTGDDPLALWVVLDEAVLRRLVSRRDIMQKQLRRLSEAADMPNVTFQILPFTAGEHVGMNGAFTILSFPDPSDPDVVYLEHTGGDLYLDRPDQVERQKLLFEHLRAVALTPVDSAAFLVELAEEL